jgi:membrane protease YdiL (CAAX protease family)
MNKSPVNYLVTAALGAVLWVVFAILMGSYLSENPNLANKDPADLASELRIIFGVGILLSIISACYWYYYGDLEKTAGDLSAAKRKWRLLFMLQIILSVVLIVTIVLMNMSEGIQPNWFGLYFALLAVLTFIFFWVTTYLMSPRTVKYVPFGKK